MLSLLLHTLLVSLPLLGESEQAAWPRMAARQPLAATLRLAEPSPSPSPRSPAATADAGQDDRALSLPPTAEPPPPAASGADLLPIPAAAYYPTAQLSRRPQPTELPALDAPEIAGLVASGKVVVTLWVDAHGGVAQVELERSDLPDAFAHAAVAAFRQARFIPGERDGRPVGSIMRIEVAYDDHRAAAGR